jgi:dTDP-3-amino-2,3,6-trideoxy-4-keto-D-glucose/dTDP-3-amino-3,4,6-trideoxy-alpha-D-glucose/dTDP-2,6-dideoxy-D-kanosamine transaminase
LIPLNDLSRNYPILLEIKEAITKVVESGNWIMGPEHNMFENELAHFLSSDSAFGVASGTDSLEIALRAVGCVNGSKIITVGNAGGYAAIAGGLIGCEVLYTDVDPVRLVMDPKPLASLLSADISAVVVTHLFGNVAPVKAIMDLCKPFNIRVIEDCAQAIGATYEGKAVGTIGDIGTFSFYPTKNLGAIGDAGAITTHDKELAKRIKQLRQYGWSEKYFIEIAGGKNSRLDEVQAAILRISLRRVNDLNFKRRQILKEYANSLIGTGISLVTSYSDDCAAHLAVLLLPKRIDREIFRKKLNDLGIQTAIHYPVLDVDQVGLSCVASLSNLPVSRDSVNRIVSIPLFPELTNEEVKTICMALASSN